MLETSEHNIYWMQQSNLTWNASELSRNCEVWRAGVEKEVRKEKEVRSGRRLVFPIGKSNTFTDWALIL